MTDTPKIVPAETEAPATPSKDDQSAGTGPAAPAENQPSAEPAPNKT